MAVDEDVELDLFLIGTFECPLFAALLDNLSPKFQTIQNPTFGEWEGRGEEEGGGR